MSEEEERSVYVGGGGEVSLCWRRMRGQFMSEEEERSVYV
jgi:hypothetical protein